MGTLSRKTIGTSIRAIEAWSRTEIELFFYENDVPGDLVFGSSKMALLLSVFQKLEARDEELKILNLIQLALPRVNETSAEELTQCLMRDGFVVDGKALIDAEPDAQEFRTAIAAMRDTHEGDLEVTTLSHHLRECEDLFRQEKWDSSIGHCRNFVEQLLKDIATALAQGRDAKPNLSQPRFVREYLQSSGFLDEPERKKLVDGVYGYFSEEGSHPGISTHSAARISKSILLSFAFYVLEKFEAWKSGELRLV